MSNFLETTGLEYAGVIGAAVLTAIERDQYFIDTLPDDDDSVTITAHNGPDSSIETYVVFQRLRLAVGPIVTIQSGSDWAIFESLAAEWRKNSKRHSSWAQSITQEPHYLRIIGMGEKAVPFIIQELRNEIAAGEPDHWFPALWAITGADPVPEADQGRIAEMARAWIKWGETQGY